MAQAVGSQFDTSVVAAFEAILAQASEEYRIGVGEEFTFGAQSTKSYGSALEVVSPPVELRAVHAKAS
jgi:hypothetical protein